MGEIVHVSASPAKIEADIREAFETGIARGGEIETATRARLEASVTAIDSTSAAHTAARQVEQTAWVAVLAIDDKADTGIGGVRDRMWTALGRPKHSAELDTVFPGGIGTYTAGDPTKQPILMQVLQARILAGAAPRWTQAMRQGWADEIEALRVPYQAAVDAHRPHEAALMVAEAAYRAAVRAGHTRLRSLKRDLKSLGLTEAQIHDIIPDGG